jgi:serine protease
MIRFTDSKSVRGWLAVGALSLGLAACESGSDDGSGGGNSASDRLTGVLSVLQTDDTSLENEPNGTVDQAHILGDLLAGQTRTVVASAADTSDDDIFQVVAPTRVLIDVVLNASDPASDLDVFIFDSVGLQQVETFASNNASESGSFVAQGTFFVLVNSAVGSSDYELSLSASALGASVAEAEPNDTALDGAYLGTFGNGDAVTFTGNGTGGTSDFLLLALPEAATLDVSLDFDGGEDYDLFFSDATADISNPVALSSLTSVNVPETGQVMVNAMTLVAVEVRPIGGAVSNYTLQIDGDAFRLAGGNGTTGGAPAALSRARRGTRLAMAHRSFPGDLIVQLSPDAGAGADPLATEGLRSGVTSSASRVDDVVRSFGGQVMETIPDGPSKVHFDLPVGLSEDEAARYTFALAASLSGMPGVMIAEPDFVMTAFAVQTTPNDPFYNLQWHYEQIQLPAAWDLTTGDSNIRVAVLDTGSAPSSDLLPREVAGFDMIDDPAIAGDGNGRDSDPTDVGDSTGVQPSSFHGAHVAGTIGAATNNGQGVAAVTWATDIVHVRVLGIGGGSTFDIQNAVLYAAGLGNASGSTTPLCQVQNLSLGGGGFSQSFQNAINNATSAGSLIVAAAGNENSSTPSYPAAYDNVISVAAVDFEQRRAPYSNFHPTVDIAAPGGDVSADRNGDGYADGVLSTKPDDSVSPTNFDSFSFYQGTSMAAPHVAGVAALLLAIDDSFTPAQLTAILTSTATDLGDAGQDNIFGHGLVNAFAAVQSAMGGGGGIPALSLDETQVLFSSATGTRRVGIANIGDGLLSVTNVTSSTNSGGNWLSASRVVSQASTTDTSAIDITINAGSLANGIYSGNVSVVSNGGTEAFTVTLSLGGAGTAESLEVFVLAVDADTFESVAQDVVLTSGSLAYGLRNVPAGSYVIVAGTDVDGDDFICDEGEPLCGLYPALGLAVQVDIAEDGTISGLDFPLEQANFTASTSGAPSGFKLLHSSRRASGDDGDSSSSTPDDHATPSEVNQ